VQSVFEILSVGRNMIRIGLLANMPTGMCKRRWYASIDTIILSYICVICHYIVNYQPHGIAAIRKHLFEVDNVPLLVSLFTDATPETVTEMVQIFRGFGETVLTIGSAFRCSNYEVFQEADVAVSLSMLPGSAAQVPVLSSSVIDKFPAMSSDSGICQSDIKLVFSLVGIGAVSLLQLPAAYLASSFMSSTPSARGSKEAQPDEPKQVRLGAISESIRLGRVFLLNMFQMLAFFIFSVFAIVMTQVVALAVPSSIPPCLSPPLILLFVCVYIPCLLLAMMFSPVMEHVMKNTPRKTIFEVRARDRERFIILLSVRVLIVMLSVFFLGWVVSIDVLQSTFVPTSFRVFVAVDKSSEVGLASHWHIQDLISFELLLSLILQACSLLRRGQTITEFPHFLSHPVFCTVSLLVVALHIGICAIRALNRQDGFYRYLRMSWIVYLVLFLAPIIGGALSFFLNEQDVTFYRRHLNFLRLEFDTRLGMHSPR